MKCGDLIRVRYEPDDQWYHGFVMTTPHSSPTSAADRVTPAWRMWCIERSAVHVLEPHKDEIEIVSEAGLTFS